MKLLVVEDDRNLNSSICEMLSSYGSIIPCYDGESALFEAEQNIYDLIILDLMLPVMSGLDVLKQLRNHSNCPVIILTAKATIEDKVIGLKYGADDYLTKPFHRDELIARINAILRRTNNEFNGISLKFKDLRFDVPHKCVYYNNERLDITLRHYEILEYLVRNKEVIITKEQLFNRIWGFDSDTIWSVVEVYISYLRKVLKEIDYHKYLKTIRNVGYMWSESE